MRVVMRAVVGLCFLSAMAGAAHAQGDQTADITIAVMDFVPVSVGREDPGVHAGMGVAIGRAMARELRAHDGFRVVGRVRVDEDAAREAVAGDRRLLDERAITMGKRLGAQAVLLGTFAPRRLCVDISAKAISVSDGRTLASEHLPVSLNPSIMEESVRALAMRLLSMYNAGLGYVMDVLVDPGAPPLLLLDLGASDGIREGTVVEILADGDEVVHPVSSRPLGRPSIPVGYAVVVYIQGAFCYARVHDPYAGYAYEPLQRVRVTDDWTPVRNNDLSVVSQTHRLSVYSDVPGGTVLLDGRTVPLRDRRALLEAHTGSHVVELVLDGASVVKRIRVASDVESQAEPPEVAFRAKELLGRIELDLSVQVDEVFLDGEQHTGRPLRSIGNVLAGTHTLVLPRLRAAGQHRSVTAVEEITVEAGKVTVVSDLSALHERVGEGDEAPLDVEPDDVPSPAPSDGLPPPKG